MTERKKGTNTKAKSTNKTKTKAKAKDNTKNSKKVWIIVCSIIAALVVIGLATWGIISLVLANQPLEQDWAQTYFVYLDENPLDPELKDAEDNTIATAEEYQVEFYDVEGVDEPVMAVNYITHEGEYLTYYWDEGEDGIKRAVIYSPSEIELLYNIKEEKNEYYIHYEKDGTEYYKNLGKEILSLKDSDNSDHVKDNSEYKFNKEDVDAVTDKDGNEHKLTKFEQTFVEVEDEEMQVATLPVNYDKNELKSTIKDEAYEYQVLEEIAKKHAEMIRQVVENVEKRQKEIEDVKKENAEIEEKKRAEEEAKKGLKLEGKTLAWGRYKLDEDWFGPNNDYITINQDGTCVYDGKSCTWYKDRKDYTQSVESTNIHDSICFKQGQYSTCLYAWADNMLGDGDIQSYRYVGR